MSHLKHPAIPKLVHGIKLYTIMRSATDYDSKVQRLVDKRKLMLKTDSKSQQKD